ncbi:MAG: Hpt domain-containing protein [Porticoccus sp.]|nr:Hpt domain-containing protein [Porticoccus sp.]
MMELKGRLQGLEWLIDEVETSLHQAYEALESYLVDPSDESQIRFCLSYIHQVHGSLKIAECHGPLLLAEEMEGLAVSMLEGHVKNVADACDVMVQAILKLPAYLRQVMTSRRDQPEILLLLLNELRVVRGEPLVSETAFFTPQMDATQKLSKPYNRQPDPVSMTNLLRKLRQMYQYALLGVVKGEKVEENFGYLDKVFSRLKELSKGLPREPLWTTVLALLEGISAKEIPLGYSVKMLLRELDSEIRQLAQAGVEGLSQPLPEVLLKNILFYIAYSRSEAPRALLVRADYHLDEALPEALLEDSEDGLSPMYHPETAQAIVAALDEEIAQVKESLDRYTMEGGDNEQLLDDASNGLRRISDSLAVVGRSELRASMEQAREQILALRNNPSDSGKGCLVLVATQLVEGEASLHGWLDNNRQLVDGSAASGEMQVEVNRAQEALLDEVRKGLVTVKSAIVEFIASQWQRENLDGVPELILDVRGALGMMTLHRAAAVLNACHQFLVAEVLAEDSVPNWNMLDALADAITSVEYYLDYVGQQDEQAEQTILGLAEEGVAKLGYPVTGDGPVVTTVGAGQPRVVINEPSADDSVEETPKEDDFADQEIIGIFVEEVTEVLELIEGAYLQWVDNPKGEEPLNEIRRGFHTLKGSGRMVGAETIGDLAWSVENLLNKVIANRVTVTPTVIAFVDLAREVMPGLCAAFQHEISYSRGDYVAQLVVAADALAKGEETSLPATEAEDTPLTDIEVQASENIVVEPESPEDSELLIIFAGEAEGHLQVVQDFVEEQRREAPVYAPPTSLVLGALHTLKGSARMAGVEPIGDLVTPIEQYARELYTYQLDVNEDVVDLLADAVDYCHQSINTRSHMGETPGLAQFLARVAELRARHISPILSKEEKEQPKVDPDALNLLMMGGIAGLLNAGESLYQWQQQPEGELPLISLRDELDQLATAAGRAGVATLNQLSLLLSRVHNNIIQQHLAPTDTLIQVLQQAHEAMLGMIDCVAANQELPSISSSLADQLEVLTAEAEPVDSPVSVEPVDTDGPVESTIVDRDIDDDVPLAEHGGDGSSIEPELPLLGELQEVAIQSLSRDDIDLEILETFTAEADELLEEIDQALQGWERDWGSKDHVESLKRSLHTLKGGARMSGLEQLGTFSHDLESDILVLENNRDQLSAAMFSRLLRQQDYLLEALAAARQLFDRDDKAVPEVEAELVTTEAEQQTQQVSDVVDVVIDLPLNPGVAGENIPQIERQAMPQEMVKVSAPLLESLVNLAGETSISRGRVEQQVNEFAFTLEEMESTIVRLRDQVRRIGMETEAHVMFRQEQIEAMSTTETEGFDPLEMDRYSQLQQLSRALLESASDLKDLKGTLADKARGAESQLLTQSRINTDLQERLMRTRMVPFSRIVPRLRRMVRQVSDELGKDVELILANVDGEMDRSVMEQMLPPLEHMIRNSIDHGIESSEERLELGKPEAGVVSVGLIREGGDILLQLSDDGRGLNVEAIRLRAIELGLMTEDSGLDHQEVIQFIFQSGFSTSKKVTHVSGRGVGMDVVYSQVRELGGSVQITTKKGEGSQFTVRLPFTVSVNRALMIEVGEDLFALPLNSVDGVVRVSAMELEHYYRFPDARLEYAGSNYEVRYLGSLLSDGLTPKIDMSAESALLVLVHSKTRSYAVQVDGLAGSNEIVVKSLGPQFSRVPGLSGATLLGDGRVVVILDLLALLRVQTTARVGVEVLNAQGSSKQPVASTVMVVDDSVTVRKVTGRFLEREGFNVITARDGVEAMKLLQDQSPDVMLLDIEMPRMDGFEVARRVKGNEELKKIPIIMITSRTGEKHRDRALALGVEQYLGKPYQEEILLEAISELIGMAVE